MTGRQYERLLKQIVSRVDTLLPTGPVGACILGSKVVIEVVRQAGGQARPLPVKVAAYSPEYARRLKAGRDPRTEDNLLEWRQAGAIGVKIGHGQPLPIEAAVDWQAAEDPWDGHLVALVDERYMVDITIGQVSARAPIPAKPFWLEVPREFVREGATVVLVDDATGTRLDYTSDPDNKDYLRGAAWADMAIRYDGRQVRVVDRRPDRTMRRG